MLTHGKAARQTNKILVTALPRNPRILILKLNLLAGASFQTHEGEPDIVSVDLEDHGFLLAIVILKANGQEVFLLLHHHEDWGDHSRQVAPVYLLAVLQQIDAAIGNSYLSMLRKKDKEGMVGDADFTVVISRNVAARPSQILYPSTGSGRSNYCTPADAKQKNQGEVTHKLLEKVRPGPRFSLRKRCGKD